MGGGGGGAPMRNVYSETADELQAKVDLAPQVYATEAQYRPQYTTLDLASLDALMNGSPGGTQTVTTPLRVTDAGWYDAQGQFLGGDRNQYRSSGPSLTGGGQFLTGGGPPGTMFGPNAGMGGTESIPEGVRWIGSGGMVNRTQTMTSPGSPGLLTMLENWSPRLAAIDAANLSAQRGADIADVGRYGAASRAAMDTADPETARLLQMMTDQAGQEMALGSRLTPEQERQISRTTMAGAGARGWGYNPGDLARTAMATTDYGQQLQDRRRQYAAGITGLRQSFYGDAFNRVLGRPASTSPMSLYGLGMQGVASAAPRMFGSTVNANDVFSSNQNAVASNNAAQANNRAAMTGAGISGAALIGAALV